MRIAVNTIFQQKDLEEHDHYIKEVFSRLTEAYSEHEFLFLFDEDPGPLFLYGPNVLPVVVRPSANNMMGTKYWYDVKAPLALRRYKPDVWVQPSGICSLTTRIPQLMLVPDLSFLHKPRLIGWQQRLYQRAFMGSFLKKARHLLTASQYTKNDITAHYRTPAEKISVAYGAAGAMYEPISWQEKQSVKERYTAHCEFFICPGGLHPRSNLLNLLKAFSLFKKWQHSNMKLVVTGAHEMAQAGLLEKLQTYKYRDDVVLTGYQTEEQVAMLTAASYAMVYPAHVSGIGLAVVEAMRCETPVITSNTGALYEMGGDAVLYADPDDPDALAKHLLGLYRDETFRQQRIDAGKEQAARFNWQETVRIFWEQITALKK